MVGPISWLRSTKRISWPQRRALHTRHCVLPRRSIDYVEKRNGKMGSKVMRQSSFPLRLASSLQEEARKTAKTEGISLNQLINLAVAEKISALRTEEFFRERGAHANIKKARKILKRTGKEPPGEGDEIL